MWLTAWLVPAALWTKVIAQVIGCTILGIGIALEVCCGSVTMPGEGFPVAISNVTSVPFHKIKICVDISLVTLAVVFCYVFFGTWLWYIVGIGTLFAMVYVGMVVTLFISILLLHSLQGFSVYLHPDLLLLIHNIQVTEAE